MRKAVELLTAAARGRRLSLCASVTLPPRPRFAARGGSDADLAARTVPGAFHVHTTRSDGLGDRAGRCRGRRARRAEVRHPHRSRRRRRVRPIRRAYIDGVLVLDGVEISTDDGHYVAFDMPAAPYPLGGAAEAVVEDVARLGGFGVAAHPGFAEAGAALDGLAAPIDGIEWLNLDSEWRDESRGRLARIAVGYVFATGAGAGVRCSIGRATLAAWDSDRQQPRGRGAGRRTTRTAGSACGRGSGARVGACRAFRLVRRRVSDVHQPRDARRAALGRCRGDARAALSGRSGGEVVFTAIDALARPRAARLLRRRWARRASRWGRGPPGAAASPDRRASILPPGARAVSLRERRRSVEPTSGEYPARRDLARAPIGSRSGPGPGARRFRGSSPIRSTSGSRGAADDGAPRGRPASLSRTSTVPGGIEKDADVEPRRLGGESGSRILTFELAPGERSSQFVALSPCRSLRTHRVQPADRVDRQVVRAAARLGSAPVRRGGGARWGRSVYLSPGGREIVVPRRRAGAARSAPASRIPRPERVVDPASSSISTNAAPGSRGAVRESRCDRPR